MKTLLAAAAWSLCLPALAQTPAPNPMPDGSRDMYAGIGFVAAPRYLGADTRRVQALPLLQVQWSNGLFIAGTSAGMHLSSRPALEFGPLVSLHPGRDSGGDGASAIGVERGPRDAAIDAQIMRGNDVSARTPDRLDGMPAIGRRLQAGGFFNAYLTPGVRLTSSLLYGAGNAHRGATVDIGMQRLAVQIAPHHTLSAEASVVWANRYYNQSFFGIEVSEASASARDPVTMAAGWRDARVALRWNWSLSPSWLLTSNLTGTRLLGARQDSPFTARSSGWTVSSGLAYRF